MNRRPPAWSLSRVAALLAVALLTLAGVRATVMQASQAAAGETPACSTRADGQRGADHAPGQAHESCAFCAAAAHAPLACEGGAVRAPAVVAFTPAADRPALGPRGPPAFRARARGPPSLS